MTIKLYNTKTRRKEDFEPINKDDVRMYVCGPTVYDRAHLGNARPVIVFDVLYRLLRHTYGPDHVTYVRNFTDVDDKINARAAESGRSIAEITAETTQWFLDDMAAVGALEPSIKDRDHQRAMPRATQYIAQMVTMIEDLIAKGHAYAAEGHVLFAVESYSKYGALSGRSIDDMIAGARVEVAPYKRNPMDFVLWKPSDDATPGWAGPVVGGKSIGRGRPGWHIECSAMAHDLLGATFDIHGGGNDLMFPHHENEIAQSTCAGHNFANVWMHNEMLQVEGKKMSKSLGNFFTVRDLLDQGVPGEVIRFVMLSTHYRKPMDWTEKKREEAEETLWKWKKLTDGAESSRRPHLEIIAALKDDLNTPLAISILHRKFAEAKSDDDKNRFLSTLLLLGIGETWRDGVDVAVEEAFQTVSLIEALIESIEKARAQKDWATSDRTRDGLESAGVKVQISKDGVSWERGPSFDPAKLEALK
ncbi:cysteine--tRNA ligase [Roseobacter denitrificans]|uniref:Cysteine--tRNA ligase n=1 Tax=Roseobacter denitrificans (strain ATCC 33942 / OCh 114) TaxID=375451 RepID=SYC_ROSDO|nr:cysteine--tRNA ligase [Roseobacter denitrificans]Q164A4.1 RecName: Full=Cysteine--tRNA ligase; AltName: Full=Cysteinyl-tRNA synthetase; Short=CysRS [Roseobacter denitrificans OCh 114]ABG32689.1 cysteinyl-tRNA synthetase [Roseobacter denitrificans OCh 114]AVL52116.1 cysteine--tRNA ligase [Roseobacter denitrificans]SFF93761.1 cysteinyl-tRNA synthetase [Roseobacter denitrificans OCh 114]